MEIVGETFPPEFVHPTVTEITVGQAERGVQFLNADFRSKKAKGAIWSECAIWGSTLL
jgi:hypothetical protein